MATEPQQVAVTRTLLPAPSIDEPGRMVYQIQYQIGTLPPHFVYCEKSKYTEKEEKRLIAEDLKKQLETKQTFVTL
jgi:hypothetical protein